MRRIHAVGGNARPPPGPRPQGEGAWFASLATITKRCLFQAMPNGSPSPGGEGCGEGEVKYSLNRDGLVAPPYFSAFCRRSAAFMPLQFTHWRGPQKMGTPPTPTPRKRP